MDVPQPNDPQPGPKPATSVMTARAHRSDQSKRLRLLLVLALAAVLGFLALRSSPYLQYIPWMPRRVGVWADSNGVLRTAVAFFGFGLVTFLLVGRSAWHVLAVCLFATSVEVAQLWIPGRSFDWKDIMAGLVGTVAAWPPAWLLRRRFA